MRYENCRMGFEIHGHRGARGLRPENTLAGFDYAIALGVTALEMDVGISKDGVVVVCHDPYINPKLCLRKGGTVLPTAPLQLLKELTVQEIQKFDCGSLNPDPTYFTKQRSIPGERIPSLQEVFDLAEAKNPHIHYNIESKVNPLQPNDTAPPNVFAEKLVDLITTHKLAERATIQSFDWSVLKFVKHLNPTIRTSALVAHQNTSSTLYHQGDPSPFLAGFKLEDFGGDIIALLAATGFVDVFSPNFETLLPESSTFLQDISAFHQAGFSVIPWTVNTADRMQQFIQLEVDGLITDYPDVLLNVLKSQKK